MASVSVQHHDGLVLCLLFAVSCFFLVRSFRPGRKQDDGGSVRVPPPSPPALPIIGNLHQIGWTQQQHRRMQALSRRHGPLFSLRLGSVPAIVVNSASLAEAVLKTQDHVFCSRPQQYTARGTLYGCRDVAFSPYGERWRQLRRITVVHLLSMKRVDSFRALREEEVASFVQRIRTAAIRAASGAQGGVNVSELIVSLTNTFISRAAFGNKLGGVEPETVREIMAELTDLLGTIAVSDMFPRLAWVDWVTGLAARVKKTASRLDDIHERVLREHVASQGNVDGEASDLLDDLLSIAKDGGQGFKLDMTDVKGLILNSTYLSHNPTTFVAGADTIYETIEWTMAELIKNPREMEKVQAEVKQVTRTDQTQGGVVLLEEQLEKVCLLQAAMKEALRLHPPGPLLIPRESMQDTRLHGYDIPAGTRVMVNAWVIGRDVGSWGEDAEEFRPERFLPQSHGDATIDYSGKEPRFIPFGAGRRGCPGIAFAVRLAELTVANMLCHFDWSLPGGMSLESFELVESSGLAPGLKSPLILVAKPL